MPVQIFPRLHFVCISYGICAILQRFLRVFSAHDLDSAISVCCIKNEYEEVCGLQTGGMCDFFLCSRVTVKFSSNPGRVFTKDLPADLPAEEDV